MTTTSTTYYTVRDASGEYVSDPSDCAGEPCRTPASNEAHQFESREDAEAACRRSTDRVIAVWSEIP